MKVALLSFKHVKGCPMWVKEGGECNHPKGQPRGCMLNKNSLPPDDCPWPDLEDEMKDPYTD